MTDAETRAPLEATQDESGYWRLANGEMHREDGSASRSEGELWLLGEPFGNRNRFNRAVELLNAEREHYRALGKREGEAATTGLLPERSDMPEWVREGVAGWHEARAKTLGDMPSIEMAARTATDLTRARLRDLQTSLLDDCLGALRARLLCAVADYDAAIESRSPDDD